MNWESYEIRLILWPFWWGFQPRFVRCLVVFQEISGMICLTLRQPCEYGFALAFGRGLGVCLLVRFGVAFRVKLSNSDSLSRIWPSAVRIILLSASLLVISPFMSTEYFSWYIDPSMGEGKRSCLFVNIRSIDIFLVSQFASGARDTTE